MKNCEQTKGLSVYEHGESVWNYMNDLLNHLKNNDNLKFNWNIPEWLYDNKDFILKEIDRVGYSTLKQYCLFHDIGKPFCLEIDSEGRRHFPNHAKVSYDVFMHIFGNKEVADLILHDMDIHLLKANDVDEFCKNKNAIIHLIVGLAEIHSNSVMFGGIESTSFKIKWKTINQRGKSILKNLNNYEKK